jgi:hypothetical protein
MTIRALTPDDLKEVERIHSLYFSKESTLLDFMKFVCAFVIEDEQGIILAGGIRDIPESVAVTDLSRSPRDRIKAIYQLIDASTFVCKNMGYDQIYAWSQTPKWTNRLKRMGLREPQGHSLIYDL